MRKITILFVALIIGIAAFAQKNQIAHKEFLQTDAAKSGWFTYYDDGGSGYVSLASWEVGEKLAMRYTPSQMSSMFSANPQITKVEIGCWNGENLDGTYSDYNGKNFTLEIYQGGSYDTGTHIYTPGTLKYTQDYVAPSYYFNKITLSTPFDINVNQDLMIAIKMNAKTTYVQSYIAIPTATTYGNLYFDTDLQIWYDVEFYTDQTQTTTEVKAWSIKIFVEDDATYTETSDIYSGFVNGTTSPYSSVTDITIEADENLVLYPVVGNDGPDDADGEVTIILSIDGIEIINEIITEFELESGYFSFLSEDGYFEFGVEYLNNLGVTGTFDVCLTAEYSGVDNIQGNNTACVTVTRNPGVEINPTEAIFNLDEPEVVSVEIYWNSATQIVSIFDNENYELIENTDFEITGDELSITIAYLESVLYENGDVIELTITFDHGVATLTITAIGEIFEGATINPIAANFDLNNPDAVETTITWNDATAIVSIIDNQDTPHSLIAGTDYELTGTTLSINTAYLETVLENADDVTVLTITFDEGIATFTITAIGEVVYEDVEINPTEVLFNLDEPEAVTVEIDWNDATTIVSIIDNQDEVYELEQDTDFVIEGNDLKISIDYIESVLHVLNDVVELTITFDHGVATLTITATDNSSILDFAYNLRLYPNPSKGEFVIEVSENLEMQVTDMLGKLITTQSLIFGTNYVSLSEQATGTYLVNLTKGETTQTFRIVIEK